MTGEPQWWRSAVIYQVYVRSFADGNGDGTGDLAGVRAKLPYLRDLGVDALWFNPWYPSPLADGGYDITDYRSVDPLFGSLDEAVRLIEEARELGIRTIVDVVPNHVSDQHPWFQAAVAAEPGSPERQRFWFADGLGCDGDEPPNNWTSEFGGRAWSRIKDRDGNPEQWYLHLFAPEQPDLNWSHPDVRKEHEAILRFWFDRGVAGIRIDSAALIVKDPGLPDVDGDYPGGQHPYLDRDGVHEIYRSWRSVADEYDEPRLLVGEVWVPDADRMALYLADDEMHSSFNFDLLACPWEPDRLREVIDKTLAMHDDRAAAPSWVLSNHDVTRPVTRYGRTDTSFAFEAKRAGTPTDPDLGRRRAEAAAMLMMALPGSVYIYQGEELGLPEFEEIDPDRIQDPMHFRSGGIDPGRDGARVPMPWSGDAPPYGFRIAGDAGDTWLPQPADWAELTVEAQKADPSSTLNLYRSALRLRRTEDDLGEGPMAWIPSTAGVLAFTRGEPFACVVNLTNDSVDLPEHASVLLASAPLDSDGRLVSDAAVWLRLSER